MNIREQYQRFRKWQLHPFEYTESREQHCCNNCGCHFSGNFCPTCGQKWNVDFVTWKSIRQGIMDVWGMGSRSLPYTLWQLMLRPGYLIGDYISGRRQVSFPPVKMLVIVAVVIYLVEKLLNIEVFGDDGDFFDLTDENTPAAFKGVLTSLSNHYDWGALLIFLFMALPTYIVFHYAPRHTRHTLPQEFFIQVFNSTQFLCLMLLWAIINIFVGFHDTNDNIPTYVLIPLIIFYNYKQLFGYGFWGTLWRMAACWVLWISLLGAVVLSFNIPKYLLDGVIDKQELPDIMIVITLAITFFMVSHFVNIFNQPVVIGQRRKVSRVFNLILMIVLALISMTFMLALVNSSISQKSGFKTTVILAILLIISLTLFYLLNRRHKSFIKKYLNEEESNEKREICLQDTEGDSQASG